MIIEESFFRSKIIEEFLKQVKDYDKQMYPIMRANDWIPTNISERTVIFTFGKITFTRRFYKRNGYICCPVDDWLGLEQYVKHSKEMIVQICNFATMLSYQKVTEVIKLAYQVVITDDTVLKSIKIAQNLLEKHTEDELLIEKVNSDVIYIEGDEFELSQNSERKHQPVIHFVIHTGVQEGSKRRELANKKSVISSNYDVAYKRVLNYIKNNFVITNNTLLITNSDNEGSFSKSNFQRLALNLKIEHHEHFIDDFFRKQRINFENMATLPLSKEKLLKGIETHDKNDVIRTLAKIVSEIKDASKKKRYSEFSEWLLYNFEDMKPPKQRNLNVEAKGILQSQHKKIARRMKKIGMNWSDKGADTVCQLIIMREENPDAIRELFFSSNKTGKDSYAL
jgi:hypothetical protein